MLAGPGPVPPETRSQQPFTRAGIGESNQPNRSRKAELRAVDGLNTVVAQRPPAPPEVIPRVRQRSRMPRPVSMTVLELRKRGSDDEIDSQRSGSRTGIDAGGFLKGGFRWRLFGKASLDKSKESDGDRDAKSPPKSGKSEAPKSALGSLRRSLSLRIRRTRPRDKATFGPEKELKENSRTRSAAEEVTMPPRPFSYLTGRTLPTSSEQIEDGAVQYIHYHSRGKVKVMEVPLCPTKLSSKPVQEEPSLWQLIANRFRRKEQPCGGKCESQPTQNKDVGQYPLEGNPKSQPVSIETPAGIDAHKGQGKTCEVAECVSRLGSRVLFSAPPPLRRKLQLKRKKEVHFFLLFLEGRANEKHMGNCEIGWHSKKRLLPESPFSGGGGYFISPVFFFIWELRVCVCV